MYRITSPDTVVRGIESDRHYNPSRDLITWRIGSQLAKNNEPRQRNAFIEGEPIFYPPDQFHQRYLPNAHVWERIEEVRMVIADILQGRGSRVYQAKQCRDWVTWGEQNFYDPKRRSLIEPDGRLYRLRDSSNDSKYGAIYPQFPKFNIDHPYLVPEELHCLEDGTYINFTPHRVDPLLLGDDCMRDLSELERVKVILDAMLACAAMHRNGAAHGDIKPDNIFVRKDHRGLVGNLFDNEFRRPISAKNDVLAGTPYYMPQSWDGDNSHLDYRHNDVFGFGMIFFEAFVCQEFSFIPQLHYSDYTAEFSRHLKKKGSISPRFREVMLSMLLGHKRGKLVPLEDCIPVIAQEFGLVQTERLGSTYIEFPSTYVPSACVQRGFRYSWQGFEGGSAGDSACG